MKEWKKIYRRFNKRSFLVRFTILTVAGGLAVAAIVVFKEPIGAGKIVEFIADALGESLAEAVD